MFSLSLSQAEQLTIFSNENALPVCVLTPNEFYSVMEAVKGAFQRTKNA